MAGNSDVVAVVDYHKGNLLSVERALSAAGTTVIVTDDAAQIARAAAVVVPGVGAFDDAMTFMRASGQDDAIREVASSGRAVLGICLGMQLLFERGNEHAAPPAPGSVPAWVPGLSILPGEVSRLEGHGVKVPHVGWNSVGLTHVGERCPLFAGIPDETYFYHTHSYACHPSDEGQVAATTEHGVRFASAVWNGGLVFGTQFHPEKSSAAGQRLVSNFVSVAMRGAL